MTVGKSVRRQGRDSSRSRRSAWTYGRRGKALGLAARRMVLTIEDQSDKTNENDRFIVLQDSREQRNASEATVTLVSVRVVLYTMSCQMRSSKSDVNESSATSTVSSRTEQHSQTRRGDRLGAVFFYNNLQFRPEDGREVRGCPCHQFSSATGAAPSSAWGGCSGVCAGPHLVVSRNRS